MKHFLLLLLLFTVACQDQVLGLADNATPLVRIHVKVTGDVQPLRPAATLARTISIQRSLTEEF